MSDLFQNITINLTNPKLSNSIVEMLNYVTLIKINLFKNPWCFVPEIIQLN